MSAALRSFLFASLLGASAAAQGMKLNPPLARPDGGDIREFEISPSGRRVVYRADQERDEVFELYSVRPASGGHVTLKISAPLVAGGDVRAFRIDPSGTRVLYAADQERVGRVQLYAVPIDGGPVVRVSTDGIALGGSLAAEAFARIDGGGTRAVFLQRDAAGDHALFSAPLDGSADPVQLTPFAPAARPIRSDFRIDPTGTHVLHRVDRDVAGVIELWSVPLAGGVAPVKLNVPLALGGVDAGLLFSEDGARVVFRATDPSDERDGLWSAALDGLGGPTRLDEPRGPGGVLGGVALDAESELVVYSASSAGAPGLFALASVPLRGGIPTPLTAFAADSVGAFRVGAGHAVFALEPGAGGDVLLYSVATDGATGPTPIDAVFVVGGPMRDDFVLTPDGRGLAFVAERADELALFTGPSDASAPPTLVDTLPATSIVAGLEFGDDAARLLYLANARDPDALELQSVPSDGSRPRTSLSGPLVFGGDVQELRIAPRGNIVVYRADAGIDGVHALYAAPVSGALAPRELNEPLPVGRIEGDVLEVELVGDGRLALYRATQEEVDRIELYAVETRPRARARKLNGSLAPGGNVERFRASPAAGRVVYVADQDADDVHELFSAPLDGSAPAVRLSRDLAPGGDVVDFVLSPDGTRAVYEADARTDEVFELFTVPIDGLGTNQRVSGDLVAGGVIDSASVAVTPDNVSLVYFADQDEDEVFQVFVAPLDAGSDPFAVSGDMVAGGDVLFVQSHPPFRMTPDGTRVLWVADAIVDERFELFSAPLDGSVVPTPLSGSLVAGGDVRPGFQLTPDGTHVVYLADALQNNTDELFVAPVSGAEPPRKLNALLFSGGRVWRFQVVPDGSRVLYLADADVRGVVELHSVPLDGSAPAVRLNSPFGPRADVSSAFEPNSPLAFVTPSGTHVVYRADRDIDGLDEVYVVPLDGSAAPLELNDSFGAPLFHTARPDLALGSDSRHAFYRAGPHGPSAVDLFRVPLDRRLPPARIGRGVERYRVAEDASRAVALADPRGTGVFELYLTLLDRARRTAAPPGRALER